MWNRAKAVFATMILITASSTVYFSVYPKTYAIAPTPREAEKTGFGPPSPRIAGQEVSLAQAQAWVSFKVRLPTSIGSFVQLRLDTETGLLEAIYAHDKPSNDATIDDVINQNGIIFMECPSGMTLHDGSQSILAAIDSTKDDPGGGLQQVNINGYVGCAGGNLDEHGVTWCTETTECRLIANVNYPLQQLVEIAQSIPVK